MSTACLLNLRKNNLIKLIGEYKGQVKLTNHINKNIHHTEKYITPTQISQIIHGRTMGERLCRKIENALKLPTYWFDMDEEDQNRLTINKDVLALANAIDSLAPSQKAALRAALINPDADTEYKQKT